jgi:hypothetical protein
MEKEREAYMVAIKRMMITRRGMEYEVGAQGRILK